MSPIVAHLTGLTIFMFSPALMPLLVHAVGAVTDRFTPGAARHGNAESRLAAA